MLPDALKSNESLKAGTAHNHVNVLDSLVKVSADVGHDGTASVGAGNGNSHKLAPDMSVIVVKNGIVAACLLCALMGVII